MDACSLLAQLCSNFDLDQKVYAVHKYAEAAHAVFNPVVLQPASHVTAFLSYATFNFKTCSLDLQRHAADTQ
eukprot:917461-Pelagomonas_calceolata.AAC.6